MEQKKNNMATASMVMGILSIVLSCCCFMGFIFGGLGILFACLSKVEQRFEGKAKAGLITGIIGLLLGVVALALWIWFFIYSASQGSFESYGFIPGIQSMLRGGLL